MEVLDEATWRTRATAHAERIEVWVRPHLERRRRGEQHPVHDFLFGYYSHRPARLRRWHPGLGVALEGAPVEQGYVATAAGAAVDPGLATQRAVLIAAIHRLLVATGSRPPMLGCFGLHEWAMVHRLPESELRHHRPLRLGTAGTDEVVQRHRIACSHFDAYRFFTPSARPLNTLAPGRDDRAAYEQPGCLHAGMDLYKHAFRLSPLVPSELVADCFALAREIRELDMRASPYDLAELGFAPVRIETAAGKQEYAAAQDGFAERAAPLRRRLIAWCDRLGDLAGPAARSTSAHTSTVPPDLQ